LNKQVIQEIGSPTDVWSLTHILAAALYGSMPPCFTKQPCIVGSYAVHYNWIISWYV